MAGFAWDSNYYRTFLWENGAAKRLGAEPESYAYSVFFSGGDVYVAGHDESTVCSVVWKNGIPMELNADPDGSYSYAYSVFVK